MGLIIVSEPPVWSRGIHYYYSRPVQELSYPLFESVTPLEMISALLSQKHGSWQARSSQDPAASSKGQSPPPGHRARLPVPRRQQDGTNAGRQGLFPIFYNWLVLASGWRWHHKNPNEHCMQRGDAKGFLFSQTPKAPGQGGNL